MARRVKCIVTGEYGTSDVFIKRNGKYFKNESIYLEYKKQNEYWVKIIEKFCYEFLGYSKGQPFPTILPKRLKELDFYDNETIYNTICENEANIIYSLNTKEFNSDYSKICYVMAIIRNNIAQMWKKNMIARNEAKKAYQPIPSNTYLSLSDIQNPKQKVKDISKYLED